MKNMSNPGSSDYRLLNDLSSNSRVVQLDPFFFVFILFFDVVIRST